MRNRFDHIAKHIGRKALSPSGTTVAHDEINPETLYADLRHEPDPARAAERDRIGLLGRLAAVPCLIEIYSDAPDASEFRACLTKHFASWQERTRKARADNKKRSKQGLSPEAVIDSFLWIITARTPTMLLTGLELRPAPHWPTGIYLFGADVLRVGLIIASELPREASTLLVRLMAAGPQLAHAIKELFALPEDAHERAVAEPFLLAFQHMLERRPSRTSYEQEIIMLLPCTWREAQIQARTEGRTEGRTEAQANAVLTVLRVRRIRVPKAARTRVLAETERSRLERWLENAITATSIAEVFDEAS